MAILGKYRKRGTEAARGFRRTVILLLLLCVVIALMALLGQKRKGRDREPAIQPAAPLPRAVRGTRSAGLPDWHPLPPGQERALLAKVVDQVPLGVREHRHAYYYLLNKMHRLSDTEVASLLDRSIRYGDYARQPDIVRGSMVEISGLLLRYERTPLDPGKAGFEAVYEGQILDADNHVCSFSVTEPHARFVPGRVDIRDARRVRLRGVFMQVIVYQNQEHPPKDVATPLVIGRRLVALPTPRFGARPISWAWIAALAAVTLAIGLWLFLGPRSVVARTRR